MTNSPAPSPTQPVALSLIAPAHNEQDNIEGLVSDVREALTDSGIAFEFIVVDDGSTDATAQRLREQMADHPWLVVHQMCDTPPGKGNGQSAAFYAGIRLARGEMIALLDADRQNDPADLPAMHKLMCAESADLVQGDRSANRRDTVVRRFSSWVGRTFRRVLLGDTVRDTGCSLRIIRKSYALRLPLQYKGMHRFIPYYTGVLGGKVVETPVNHRPRTAGEAKYGVWNRALPGLIDLIAARWMRSRLRPTEARALDRES